MDLAESRKKSPMDIPDRRALAASKHRGLSHLPVSTAREGERAPSALHRTGGHSPLPLLTIGSHIPGLGYVCKKKGAVTNDKHGRSQSGSIVAIEWVAA